MLVALARERKFLGRMQKSRPPSELDCVLEWFLRLGAGLYFSSLRPTTSAVHQRTPMAPVVNLSPTKVSSLIELHSQLVAQASPPPAFPSLSPTLTRRTMSSATLDASSSLSPPTSPPPVPAVAALVASSDPVSSRGGTPPASMSGSMTLGDIKEGEALVVEEAAADSDSDGDLEDGNMTESVLFPSPSAATAASAEDSPPATDASASLPTPPPSARSEAKPQVVNENPITKIVEGGHRAVLWACHQGES